MEDRKFQDVMDLDGWEILSEDGYVPISKLMKTIPYDVYTIKTKNHEIRCADDHRFFTIDEKTVYAKELSIGDFILSEDGYDEIVSIDISSKQEEMYDVEVLSDKHSFLGNGISNHNTTVSTVYLTHLILFNEDKKVAALANKLSMAREIMSRIQLAYTNLPKWMQLGVVEYNKSTLELENGSKITCAATSSDSIRGQSFSCVTGDTKIILKDQFGDVYVKRIDSLVSFQDKRPMKLYKYKVIDKRENKEYFFTHRSEDANDGFIGNISQIENSLKSYGSDNFISEVLYGEENVSDEVELKYTIFTPSGFKEYDGISISFEKRDKIKLVFQDGKILKCTPEHRIFYDKGFIEVKNLNDENIQKISYQDDEPVYDIISVKETNSYYTNGILSHNCVFLDECIGRESSITIRDKETRKTKTLSMNEFWEMI